MQNLRNCPKHLIILVVLFLGAISVQAQQSNAILTNAAHNGIANTQVANAAAFTVSQKSGKIYVSDGVSKKVVAPVQNNAQPVVAAGHVFYINTAVSNKMVIKAYDVVNGTTSDIVRAENLNSGRPTDKKITNMVYDNVSGRLYFSTVSVNAQGYENYLTWYYDAATSDVKLFADGKVLSVDNAGAIQTEMHSVDPAGTYTQTHIRAMNGTPGAMGTRIYTHSTANTSNN